MFSNNLFKTIAWFRWPLILLSLAVASLSSPVHAAPAELFIPGSIAFGPSSTLEIELAGNSIGPPTEYDRLIVAGTATLGGTLDVLFIDGFENGITVSDQFTILEAVSLAGNFSNVLPGDRVTIEEFNATLRVDYGLTSPFDPNHVVLSSLLYLPNLATWTGGDDQWTVASNWDINEVPNNATPFFYDVAIPTGIAILNSPVEIEALAVSGGTAHIASSLSVNANTNITNGALNVSGNSTDLFGTTSLSNSGAVVVDGSGSTLRLHQAADLSETSSMVVQNGATLDLLAASSAIADSGLLTATGLGSRVQGNLSITLGGNDELTPARVHVLNGAVIAPTSPGDGIEFVSAGVNTFSEILIDGTGSLYDTGSAPLALASASNTVGTLQVSGGGMVTVGNSLTVGAASGSAGTIDVNNGTMTVGSDATLAGAGGGTAVVNLFPGGLFHVQGLASLGTGAALNLFGGELRLVDFANLQMSGGTFNWNDGTIRSTGGTPLTPTISALLLPSGTLDFGKKMQVDGNLTLQTSVNLDGGHLAIGGLTNESLLQLSSGTFEWLGSELIVGSGGPLGASIALTPNLTIKVNGQLTNQGLITGNGTLVGDLLNQTGAEVRIEQGNSITFNGASHTNSGQIQLLGGHFALNGSLTNSSDGDILGRGTLDVGGAGLSNQGDLVFSNGQSDIFGDVANLTSGRVIISGNADVTFWDDVTDSGTVFNVSTGSSATFFGTAGFGISGGGDVFFEADVTPGSSPGLETFGGNVLFGVLSSLEIEIAGTTQGSQFDALTIGGLANLDGTLNVSLLDGYVPIAGDTFEIVSAGQLTGTFTNEILPALTELLAWDVDYDTTNNLVTLAVVPALPGDFDIDSDVDGFDFLKWQRGESLDPLSTSDLADWKGNFGTAAPLSSASSAVPEPSAGILLVLGMITLLGSRRTV